MADDGHPYIKALKKKGREGKRGKREEFCRDQSRLEVAVAAAIFGPDQLKFFSILYRPSTVAPYPTTPSRRQLQGSVVTNSFTPWCTGIGVWSVLGTFSTESGLNGVDLTGLNFGAWFPPYIDDHWRSIDTERPNTTLICFSTFKKLLVVSGMYNVSTSTAFDQ